MTRPRTSAPPLNAAPSGAPRHRVFAIRFSGVQNPGPASHSAIIDHIAMTTPPPSPARAPHVSVSLFIAASQTAVSDGVGDNRRQRAFTGDSVSEMTQYPRGVTSRGLDA